MQRNLDKALFFIQSGLVDSKLINIRNEGAKIKVLSIEGYLAELVPNHVRTPGAIVVILVPNEGYTPQSLYTISQFRDNIVNFTTKYYTFIGGQTNENFKEVPFGVYTYIAYASDKLGTDFTTTISDSLEYMAILISKNKISEPSAEDFEGLWYKYRYVKEIIAGNGMNFGDITISGEIVLGTPSTITGSSINEVTTNSHTHKLEITASDVVNAPSTNISSTNVQDALVELSIDISGKEDFSNKVSSISSMSTNIQYPTAKLLYDSLNLKLDKSLKGTPGGVAELDSNGFVLNTQLPSYVDDVLEYANFLSLPVTGESGKIYVTVDDNKTFRWSGTVFTEISSSLALGEVPTTAYRGDRGKVAYDYSQIGHITLGDVRIDNWNTAYSNRITSLTTIGSNEAATLISNVLNIPNYTLIGLGGQPKLNGIGFVKIDGEDIIYDSTNYEVAFSKNTGFNLNLGTSSGTVLEGRTFGTAANSNVEDFVPVTESGNYVRLNPTSTQLGNISISGTINGAALLEDSANNLLLGYQSGGALVTGMQKNTFIGFQSGKGGLHTSNTGNNTGIGYQSLYKLTSGRLNTAIGSMSLFANNTGEHNTAIGLLSMAGNIDGTFNIAVGSNAGRYIADGITEKGNGHYSTYLGGMTKASANNVNNEIAIGYNVIGAGANKTVIGNSSMTDVYFGSSSALANVRANKFIKTDGTPLQILMADGSTTNSSSYAPASPSGNYVQVSPPSAQSGNIDMSGIGAFGNGVYASTNININSCYTSDGGGKVWGFGQGTGTGDPSIFGFYNATDSQLPFRFSNIAAIFSGSVSATQLQSTVTTGTAPLTVASTTMVVNLNADLLDGKHADEFTLSSTTITQNSHGFTVGTAIKLTGSTWVKSKADSAANAGTIGIVSQVVDVNTFKYITGGLLTGPYISGAIYFLSTTAAGTLFTFTEEEAWNIGEVREYIGTGTSNGLLVEIDLGLEIDEVLIPTSIWQLTDVSNEGWAEGKLLKFDANGNLVVGIDLQGTGGTGITLADFSASLPLAYNSTSGTFSVASGYTIPTTIEKGHYDDAYNWGDHSTKGYCLTSALNAHTSLTTTAHGLGESAFHNDNYFSLLAGSSSITTLGIITTGVWRGTAITDAYISSASTWNNKENALTFVSSINRTGNTISLVNDSSPSSGSNYYYGTNSSGVKGFFILGSLAFSNATYDNYGSWTLQGDGLNDSNITTGTVVNIRGTGATTVVKTAGTGIVTINSTNTWEANSSSVAGYVAAPGSSSNMVWKTDGFGNPAWRLETTYSTFTRSSTGLVPAPGNTTTNRYLREDGSWVIPPDTITSVNNGLLTLNTGGGALNGTATFSANQSSSSTFTVSHTVGNGYAHIPVDGNTGQILQWYSTGIASWKTLGTSAQYLDGSGNWSIPPGSVDTNWYPTTMSISGNILTLSGIGMNDVAISLFAGNGSATTASHSDHYHSYELPLSFSNSIIRNLNEITLVNDSLSPGNSYYYGTNNGGTKGFFPINNGALTLNTTAGALSGSAVFTADQSTASTFTVTHSTSPGYIHLPAGGGSGDILGWSSSGTGQWIATNYQPLDADLTAIAALTGTSGILKKTSTNTWVLDTTAYVSGTPWTSMGYLTGITSSQVTTALGYTPYNATNPNGYITGTSLNGYATQSWVINNYVALSDYRLENSRPASDVYSWAKAITKPSYTYSEVGAASAGHNHSGVYEPYLSTPSVSGYVLSSTTGGVRSWVPMSSGGGTVTSITAGTGLTGGTITSSGTIAVNFGYTGTTVAYGNHNHDGVYVPMANQGKVYIGAYGSNGFGVMSPSYFYNSDGVIYPYLSDSPSSGTSLPITSGAVYVALSEKANISGALSQAFSAYSYSIYGGYLISTNNEGLWGVYSSNSNYNGWILSADGTGIRSNNFILYSDYRLKNNIQQINSVTWADDINFVNFTMKSDETNRLRYGVIAQQLECIAPELVITGADGIKSVSYTDLLIAKVARLEQLINNLENKIKQIENE